MDDQNEAEKTPTIDETLRSIGVSAAYRALDSKESHVADRTGDLMRAAMAITGELRHAEVIGVTEPDTGVKGMIVLKPDGSVLPVPSTVFDQYREEPKARVGQSIMRTEDSFIGIVNRQKLPQSAIFIDDSRPSAPTALAVFDYHGALAEESAGFCKHSAFFGFPLSDEWLAWNKFHGQALSLVEFATFIDNRYLDVEDVSSLNDLSGGVRLRAEHIGLSLFATKVKLLDVAKGIAMHTDGKGGKLNMPRAFMVLIPVIKAGPLYRIVARLKYRKAEGSVKFWYELQAEQDVFDHAIAEAVERIQEATELPVFYGVPEEAQKQATNLSASNALKSAAISAS